MKLFWAEALLGLSWTGMVGTGLWAENEAIVSTPTTAVGALIAGFSMLTGLMVWIVKRLLDTTIPTMQTGFQSALDRQQQSFERLLKESQESFRAGLMEQRQFYTQQ